MMRRRTEASALREADAGATSTHERSDDGSDSASTAWSVDKSEVSWKIGTKAPLQQKVAADAEGPENISIVSHMIVGVALSYFVYNVLVIVDHDLVNPRYWQRYNFKAAQQQAWERVFPPNPALSTWNVPSDSEVGLTTDEDARTPAAGTPFARSPGIGKMREVPFNNDWVDEAMDYGKPTVVRGAVKWQAIQKWEPSFMAAQLETVHPHISTGKSVRMHSIVHPYGELKNVSWARPWTERDMSGEEFFAPTKENAYLFKPLKDLPEAVRTAVGSLESLTVPWRKVEEVNAWFGGPGVTTPLHYDAMHNSYAQVRGQKRFILFPAKQHKNLYLFPRIHPSSRMSQVDLQEQSAGSTKKPSLFQDFAKAAPHAVEVTLGPGDALYIPPYWFHYVEVASSDMTSMSISVHTESEAARIRDRILVHELPIAAEWSPPVKAAALELYIGALFNATRKHAKDGGRSADKAGFHRVPFMRALLRSRFATLLEHDAPANSPGLREGVEAARKAFAARFTERRGRHPGGRSPLRVETLHLIEEHARLFGRVMRRKDGRKGLPIEQKEIELANYVEDVTAAVVGPAYTEAFFRVLAV